MNDIAISGELAASLKAPSKIERIKIGSRDQWMALRQKDVTASAAAALLGIHPYQTAYGLWALKTGLISDDAEETPPMKRGRLLEPLAVQILREEYPKWTFSDHPIGLYFRDPAARLGATPDLFARDETGRWTVVQIKSVEANIFRQQWKDEDGNVSPPLWIAVQALIETSLTGFDRAMVAPLVVGHGVTLPLIEIPLHAQIIDRIKNEVAAFWRLVEEGRTPEPDYGKDGALLAQLHAGDDRIVDMSADNEFPSLVANREKLSAERKVIDGSWEENKARLLAKLDGAGAARMADGRLLTAKRIKVAAHQRAESTRIDIRIKKGAAA